MKGKPFDFRLWLIFAVPMSGSTSYLSASRRFPKKVKHLSLTTLWEKSVKIGAKVVAHGRYVTFQMAEVAVPHDLFRKVLRLIDDLRRRPTPA